MRPYTDDEGRSVEGVHGRVVPFQVKVDEKKEEKSVLRNVLSLTPASTGGDQRRHATNRKHFGV